MDSAQDTTYLRESYHPWEDPESQRARELRYVKDLEEVKAKILILEQALADQPGSKDLQEKLVDARHWHEVRDKGLSAVQALRISQEQLAYERKLRALQQAKQEQPSRQLYPTAEGHLKEL